MKSNIFVEVTDISHLQLTYLSSCRFFLIEDAEWNLNIIGIYSHL